MNGRMVTFILEDTVSVKKNLGKHLLLVSLFVSFYSLYFIFFIALLKLLTMKYLHCLH